MAGTGAAVTSRTAPLSAVGLQFGLQSRRHGADLQSRRDSPPRSAVRSSASRRSTATGLTTRTACRLDSRRSSALGGRSWSARSAPSGSCARASSTSPRSASCSPRPRLARPMYRGNTAVSEPSGCQPEGTDEMGERFAIVIGVAAAGVMALGAQTAAAAPKVVKYGAEVDDLQGQGHCLGPGGVEGQELPQAATGGPVQTAPRRRSRAPHCPKQLSSIPIPWQERVACK